MSGEFHPKGLQGIVLYEQVEPGVFKPTQLLQGQDGVLFSRPRRSAGYEVHEKADVTNARGTLVLSGAASAFARLSDEGSSSITCVWIVINAKDADEADVRLATPGARLSLFLGQERELPFDPLDPAVRIDYMADAAETGSNLLYFEAHK